MTPAAELWAAVVKHCATGRGYSIGLSDDMLMLMRHGVPFSIVRKNHSAPTWSAEYPLINIYEELPTADEAVRAALRIVAPSTEPTA